MSILNSNFLRKAKIMGIETQSFHPFGTPENRMILSIPLRGKRKWKDDYSGDCPYCHKTLWQANAVLSDTYNCIFQCPFCGAYMFLSPGKDKGLRGYINGIMHFDLPNKEEIKMNGLPENAPTSD